MRTITCVNDFRDIARKRIPRAIFDYADGGSYDEQTLRANAEDFRGLLLRQRVMVDVSRRSLATSVLGQKISLPLAIAPTGLTGLFYADGEIHGALAAEKAGIPFCLSTMSICSIEDVRAAVTMPFWFQLYIMKDRGVARSLVERARAAQCSALVLTVDLQVHGQRHRDLRNGLAVPPRLTLRNAVDIATKPAWALGVLAGKRRTFGNLMPYVASAKGFNTLAQWIGGSFDQTLNWSDVAWVRDLWPGKLVIKGILDPRDAAAAVDAGADAIVVSNHGGRQLDGVRSSISALPGIMDAVGARTEVLFDGGVTSGQSILKAAALGARACLVGKAFLYALAAGGGAGVSRMIDILRQELDVALALTGSTDILSVDRSILDTSV